MSKFYATLNFGRHIGHLTPSWFDKKLFFFETCPTTIKTQIIQHNAKTLKTHWVMIEKLNFQPFWKSPPFWKPVERTSQFFKIFKLSYFCKMWQKIKIFKYTLFEIMSFLWINFSAQFFGKTALKKIQDGIPMAILTLYSNIKFCFEFYIRLENFLTIAVV
jgi:hypothetical protein